MVGNRIHTKAPSRFVSWVLFLLILAVFLISCDTEGKRFGGSAREGAAVPEAEAADKAAGESSGSLTGEVPLDPAAWWPKFRADARQSGKIDRSVSEDGRGTVDSPWEFPTGKGIFSSPVIDGEGNIYIGSADHYFYCLNPNGSLKWRVATDEIIDSSALLDDRGRVYFGSGDRHVYCLERKTGKKIWSFEAHTPEEVEEEYGIKTFNVAWFEGNIAMLPGGDILAPNDNYLLYRLDRDTGEPKGVYPANEMIWSLAAVDARKRPNLLRFQFYSAFQRVLLRRGNRQAAMEKGRFGHQRRLSSLYRRIRCARRL